jgi:hypothetical protein
MFVDVDKKMGWAILFANSDDHRGTVAMIVKNIFAENNSVFTQYTALFAKNIAS